MEKLIKVIENAIGNKIFPGCVIGFVKKNGYRQILSFGNYEYSPTSRSMQDDSIFDVASITKSIPCSSLALKAVEQNKIGLNDRLIKYIPEYFGSFRNEIRIRHLFTHTLDFNFSLSSHKYFKPEKIIDTVMNAELETQPGNTFSYCNATSILLGIVVERVFGKHLDKLAEEYFFRPLNMTKTTFRPDDNIKLNIVPTETDKWRGKKIQGETHDESAWVLKNIMIPGSAGLFSTVPDLLNFIEMLLNNGMFKSNSYFNENTITMMSTNQISDIGMCTGLGWELNQINFMGDCSSYRTIGKTGFTGCAVVCDLKKKTGLAFLSNYTWPERKYNADLINRVRRQVADIVFSYC